MKKIIFSVAIISIFSIAAKAQDLGSIFGTIKKEVDKVNTANKPKSTTSSTTKIDTVKVVNGSSQTNSTATTNQPLVLNSNLSNSVISSGLKEALSIGLTDGIKTLSQKNGFYNNSVAKILMPEELQTVEKTLRSLGMGSLADKGVKLLNTAAEDAVSEAAPIFVNALTTMTITDAKGILLGGNNSATNYLKLKTNTDLTKAFQPKIEGKINVQLKGSAGFKLKYGVDSGNKASRNTNTTSGKGLHIIPTIFCSGVEAGGSRIRGGDPGFILNF